MRVALLGAGHIAHALAEGWSRPGVPADRRPRLVIYDPSPGRAEELARAAGGEAAVSARQAVAAADLVVLAMRPDDVPAALDDIAAGLGDTALISLAAYVTLAQLIAHLAGGARVGRLMPNVAAAAGKGIALLVDGTLGNTIADEVADLFGLTGTVVRIDEARYDAATAVAGCGPAFAAYELAALAEAGETLGLDHELAVQLATVALEGAAALVRRGADPDELVRTIAVPGGMTAAGIESYETHGVRAAMGDAVLQAARRAAERR